MLVSMLRNAVGLLGHFQPHARSLPPFPFAPYVLQLFMPDINDACRPHLPVPYAEGLTSVTTTKRAPVWRTTAAAMRPMGPAPVISTSSPDTEKPMRYGRHCRTHPDRSDIAIDVVVMMPDVGHGQSDIFGEGPRDDSRRCPASSGTDDDARQRSLRQRPQTTWPSPLTISPDEGMFELTATISPRMC